MTIAILTASTFALSYSLALGRPTAEHIPAGLVGNSASGPALISALELETHGSLSFQRYPSAAAQHALNEQRILPRGLVLSSHRTSLLIASAAGTSVARLLKQAATKASQESAQPLTVIDLHPLPTNDPSGLVTF